MSTARFRTPGGGTARLAIAASAVAIALAAGCSSSSNTSTPHASGTTSTASASAATPATSASSPSPAATGKLTGAAATALAAKAIANTRAATSVQVAGKGIANVGTKGQTVSFDLLLVKNQGCSGTISASSTQTFKIVQTGGYIWLMPSAEFYKSLHLSKQATALVADKYIKVKANDKQVAELTTVCTFKGLFATLPTPSGMNFTAIPVTYQGAPAYQVTQSGKPGVATVSNTAKPLLLKITALEGSGSITFADYNSAKTITAPTAAESLDGSQLGI
jgi:hypothetical protein